MDFLIDILGYMTLGFLLFWVLLVLIAISSKG
jgi:hypothetical protein